MYKLLVFASLVAVIGMHVMIGVHPEPAVEQHMTEYRYTLNNWTHCYARSSETEPCLCETYYRTSTFKAVSSRVSTSTFKFYPLEPDVYGIHIVEQTMFIRTIPSYDIPFWEHVNYNELVPYSPSYADPLIDQDDTSGWVYFEIGYDVPECIQHGLDKWWNGTLPFDSEYETFVVRC